MIELTAQDGQPLAVNAAAVWHVRAAGGDQTAIYSGSGAALFVRERYAEVCDRLRTALRSAPGHARERS